MLGLLDRLGICSQVLSLLVNIRYEIVQSGLSEIESGRRPVTDIEVVTLAKALKVSVAWLLKETDIRPY